MKLIVMYIYPNVYNYFCGNNEDPPNEKKPRLFSQSLLSKGVSHYHLDLTNTQRQEREWESFMVKKGRFKYSLIGSCWRKLEVG